MNHDTPDKDIRGQASEKDGKGEKRCERCEGCKRWETEDRGLNRNVQCRISNDEVIRYNVGMQEYYVYILASRKNGTLYVGMTEDITKRVVRHKVGRGSKFVKKHNVQRLVYFEKAKNYAEAHRRERQLKWWERKWKLALIEQINPKWDDLSKEILDPRS
jgi:putative endonuclease